MVKVLKVHEASNIDSGTALAAPATAGDTLVGTTSTQTLTNKTITAPVLSGSVTGTYTLAGTPTITAPAISAPVITGACTIADGAVLTTPQIAQIDDTANTNRIILNAAAKTIVDGSATSLFEVAVTAGQMVGGTFSFLIRASDATDHQAIAGYASYAAVNKAGTTTRTVTYDAANEAKAVSAGTLTLSFTATDDTNKTTIKLQPTGSLTETTYTIEYTIFPIRGTVTIL